jgi:hypothetical protein
MSKATVLYNDRTEAVTARTDGKDLWIAPEDLTTINEFVLKPEGACLDDICLPVRDEDTALREAAPPRRINLTELARRLGQACLVDERASVWSFGAIPALRSRFVDDAVAPDFTLTDRHGNAVTLSKFRDNKVVIMTWASW